MVALIFDGRERSLQLVSSLGNFLQHHWSGLIYVHIMSKQLANSFQPVKKLVKPGFLCVYDIAAYWLVDLVFTFSPVFWLRCAGAIRSDSISIACHPFPWSTSCRLNQWAWSQAAWNTNVQELWELGQVTPLPHLWNGNNSRIYFLRCLRVSEWITEELAWSWQVTKNINCYQEAHWRWVWLGLGWGVVEGKHRHLQLNSNKIIKI